MSKKFELPPRTAALIQETRNLTVLTGAGISAESGIPTFREAQQGLWARYSPEELATPGAFRENPRRVLSWYRWRVSLVRDAEPNPGHHALARLEKEIASQKGEFTLITQNVDRLHQRAGSEKVLEIHGNLEQLICAECRRSSAKDLRTWDPEEDLPRCNACSGILRPNVVWFGESLDSSVLERAQLASSTADIYLSIGTSAVVHPAASLPHLAAEQGATLLEINPEPTPLSPHVEHRFSYPAGEILPVLVGEAFPPS
jgi:NAD-dependent deacetylase